MRDRKLSFTAFCASLGLPLHNMRWSWSARTPGLRRSVFTIWESGLINGRYVFWDPSDGAKRNHGGRTELVRIFKETQESGDLALGILCQAKDITKEPRTRKSYEAATLLVLELKQEELELVGYVRGQTTPADVLGGRYIALGPFASAVDDLDPDPPGNERPDRRSKTGSGFLRDQAIRSAVVRRAKGRCEYCGRTDFLEPDGIGYVETHHIISLAQLGPDTMANVIGLCSGHHREAHYGMDSTRLEKEFLSVLSGT